MNQQQNARLRNAGFATFFFSGICAISAGVVVSLLQEEYGFAYHSSLFSMKPILKASEIDDSRPTVVRVMNDEPKLVSVLSGKINTVYDLDEVLDV